MAWSSFPYITLTFQQKEIISFLPCFDLPLSGCIPDVSVLLTAPLYQNITDHLNPFWRNHYWERFVASFPFPNIPYPPLSSPFPLNGSSYPIIHLRPLSPPLMIRSCIYFLGKWTPRELRGHCSFMNQQCGSILALWLAFGSFASSGLTASR